jgi:3-deoxy-D-manno-octulosonic-acid transferase
MLRELDCVVAQNATDGERFVALGLPRERLVVSGSVKFDLAISDELQQRAAQLRARIGTRPVWIAASTHAGEDEILLAAQRELLVPQPDALLILVPRHPERFNEVATLIQRASFAMQRRSTGDDVAMATQVWLGDTMGELLLLLGVADVAFVGGSLIPRGGHNMLEPAAWGVPIITGDSDFNFREISALLMQAGALVKCNSAATLAAELQRLLVDVGERTRRGCAARQVVENNRGALARLLDEIDRLAAP